jgi:hypothetical protein
MTTHLDSWIGQVLANGRYQVIARLGEGGMGLVYRATDRNLATDVVIKAPRRSLLEDPKFAGRFAREIRSLVQLTHPHIVKVLDVGEHDGLTFAVMQYLSGGTLRDRLNATDTVTEALRHDQLLGWLPDVAEALDFIHARRYVHRDVKPENILFDEAGHVYLSDFGIAKIVADLQTNLTNTGAVVGTPHYMSPEQLHEKTIDGRADQYALAVMVYELLAGRRPFEGPSALVIALHMTQAAPPLHQVAAGVSPHVSAVVSRALEKNPNDRYPSCRAFAEALLAQSRAAAPGEPILTVQAAATVESVPTATALCPGCGKQVAVRSQSPGQRVRCSNCQEVFQPPRVSRPPARPLPAGHDTRTEDELPTLPAPRSVAPRPSSAGGWLAALSVLLAIPSVLLPLLSFWPVGLIDDPLTPYGAMSTCLGLTLGIPAVLLGMVGLFVVRRNPRRFFATSMLLLGLLAGLAGLFLGIGSYGFVAVRASREAAKGMTAQNNLRQIGMEKNGLSWRVHLLPYLDDAPLHAQFKLDEPWDSPHNLPLASRLPAVYRDPFTSGDQGGKTYYRALVGPGTLLKSQEGARLLDAWDGTSMTIVIVEAAEPVFWSKPDELRYDPQGPLPAFRVSPRGEFRALFADGSVQLLSAWNNDAALRAYITANGKELVTFPGR